MGHLGRRAQVREAHERVGRRLDVHHARLGAHRVGDALRVARVDVREGDAQMREELVEEAERAAVDVLAADHVIAGAAELHDRVEAAHPAREREAVARPFERGDVPLQRLPRGILAPGVLVALVLTQRVLDVGRRLVDRRHDGAGRRIGLLAGVDRAGTEASAGEGVVLDTRHDAQNSGGRRWFRRVVYPTFVFMVALALAPSPTVALPSTAASSLLGPDEPARVLVVDDELRLRQLVVRVMTRDGFECRDAADGAAALDVLAEWPAPLVLSDLRMPGVGGVELLQTIRERYPTTAVVMITAVADVEVAVQCLAMGAMDYLTKPFHLEEVRARVRQALERRRLIVDNRAYQRGLEAQVAKQAQRIEALSLASMQALADALEVKDPYTRGHSLRVGRFAAAIGRVMGADAAAIVQLELGGHLHDLGKIGVREAVLNKPGPLTDEEYAHIMTHPVIGWRLLKPLMDDRPTALAVVRSHHERWDGRGGPDRLGELDIPYEARVASVADSFDAMTSRRPYRRSLTIEAAVAELRRCSGSQYDPNVVGALIDAVAAGQIEVDPCV